MKAVISTVSERLEILELEYWGIEGKIANHHLAYDNTHIIKLLEEVNFMDFTSSQYILIEGGSY